MDTSHTIASLVERFSDQLWKPGTHKNSSIGFLIELADIKRDAFSNFEASYYSELADELAKRGDKNATINRKLSALQKLLRKAQEEKLVPNVPVFKRRTEDREEVRILTIAEELSLFKALSERSSDHRDFALFLIDTGVKPGEAIALRWESVFAGQFHIPVSNMGLARTLPLTARLKEMLHRREVENQGPFRRIDMQQFRLTLQTVKADIGLGDDKNIVSTTLRHTCACRMIMQGVNLRLVQHWLGLRNHKSMARYEKFAKLDSFELCVKALENFSGEVRA